MVYAPPIPILPLLEGREGRLRAMRFWSKVNMRGPDECWPWIASKTHGGGGYGRFKITSYTSVHSNRVAWTLHHGRDPGDLIIRHSCDNPPCCNPAHLEIGTHADNTRDKIERGRWRGGRNDGVNNPRAKIDETHLEQIVAGLKLGLNNKQIAEGLPIGHATVSRIRVGLAWQKQSAALGWEPRAQFVRTSHSGAAA